VTVAALYVQTDGVYYGLPDVDPWDEQRDALGKTAASATQIAFRDLLLDLARGAWA
jgi:hypothetical protein